MFRNRFCPREETRLLSSHFISAKHPPYQISPRRLFWKIFQTKEKHVDCEKLKILMKLRFINGYFGIEKIFPWSSWHEHLILITVWVISSHFYWTQVYLGSDLFFFVSGTTWWPNFKRMQVVPKSDLAPPWWPTETEIIF